VIDRYFARPARARLPRVETITTFRPSAKPWGPSKWFRGEHQSVNLPVGINFISHTLPLAKDKNLTFSGSPFPRNQGSLDLWLKFAPIPTGIGVQRCEQ